MGQVDRQPVDGKAHVDAASLPLGKRLLFTTILVTMSFAVALVMGEVAVRIVAPQQLIVFRPDIWAPEDSIGYRHAEDLDTRINTGEREVSFHTDSEGFRVGEAGRRSAPDSILLIGDSFMVAMQVEHEQSLAGLLEHELKGPEGKSVAVRNAGVDGWDPSQYLIFGRRRLAEHRYGLMLVSVFTGNDVVPRKREYLPARQMERPGLQFPWSLSVQAWIRGVARPINDILEQRSHLFVFLKKRTELLRIHLGLSPLYIPRGVLKERADGPDWTVTADILKELGQSASDAAVPALFVLIPARYQVNRELFASHATAFGVDTTAVDLDQPNVLLSRELRERGLDVVDALPRFLEAQREGIVLYGSVDTHLSPEGHAVLFDLLEGPLEARLWR